MSTEREEAWHNAKWGEVWVLTINGVEHVQRVTQRGDFADLYRDDCGWVADASAITAGRRIWPETTQAPTDDEREALTQADLDSERLRQIAEWLSMELGHEETAKRVNLIADRHDALALRSPAQGEPTEARVGAARKAIHRALAPNWMTVVQALDGNQHEYEAFIDTIADAALHAAFTAGQEDKP